MLLWTVEKGKSETREPSKRQSCHEVTKPPPFTVTRVPTASDGGPEENRGAVKSGARLRRGEGLPGASRALRNSRGYTAWRSSVLLSLEFLGFLCGEDPEDVDAGGRTCASDRPAPVLHFDWFGVLDSDLLLGFDVVGCVFHAAKHADKGYNRYYDWLLIVIRNLSLARATLIQRGSHPSSLEDDPSELCPDSVGTPHPPACRV